MQVARTGSELQAAQAGLRRDGAVRLALVPTMGALHDGHLALVAAGREQADAVIASVFVNPTQFAAGEDLSRYPRDEAGDLAKLEQAGCALAWLPSVETMYPPGDATRVSVEGPSAGFEGTARPTHFTGVATVVLKLLAQTGPDVALFGEKDWQQLQVVRRMARDLSLPVAIVGVPTRREADGLAMSSRNRFLEADERRRAPQLYACLQHAASLLPVGASSAPVLDDAVAMLRRAGFAIDYLAAVQAETMQPLTTISATARLVAAARLGAVRLLDNVPLG